MYRSEPQPENYLRSLPSVASICRKLLFVIVAASSLASAASVKERTPASGAFRLETKLKIRSTVRYRSHAYARALRKYAHWADDSHAILSKAAAMVHASSVIATPLQHEFEYTVPVKIGTQTFQLILDTGSSDLWVLGNTMPHKLSHMYYEPGSTGILQKDLTWNLSYVDGSGVSGIVYSDEVTIGTTQVASQIVQSANFTNRFNSPNASFDGVVGLAFDNLNSVRPNPAATFFTNAIQQGLPLALFTSLLKHQATSLYTFGQIDPSQFRGNIAYTPVDSSTGLWSFTPKSFRVGNEIIQSSKLEGVADTGTSIMLLENSITDSYYYSVRSALYDNSYGAYVFDCDEVLPDFALDIDDSYVAVVPGSLMNYEVLDGNTCMGAIQPRDKIPFNIYGDTLLKSQVVVWDRTQATPRLGFAAQA